MCNGLEGVERELAEPFSFNEHEFVVPAWEEFVGEWGNVKVCVDAGGW
jgi:hypothetical protein